MPPASSREKPVRKRNVVSRGRTGCLTCRRRRLKCDEMKPGCNNCRRINFPCEGYTQRITFKDQTNLIVSRASGKPAGKKGQASSARKEEIGGTDDAFSTHSCQNSDGVKRPSSPSTPQSLKPKTEDTDITVRRNSNSRFTPETRESCIITENPGRRFSSSQSDPFSTPEHSSVVIRNGYMTPRSSISAGYTPSPSRVLPNSSLSLTGAFEFPEDYTYYEYSASGGFLSLSKVLPLTELLKSQPVSSHVYDAAMALAALTLSSSEYSPRASINIRRHAFHHSLKAIQGLNNELSSSKSANSSYYSMDTDAVFSPFATAMLLANFELQRGAVPSWRSHMQGAALCLSVGYKQIMQNPVGMLLIRAFARMALLLRLYNKDYSVTTPDTVPPKIAKWLDLLLRQSPNLHDRILLLIEEVTALEIEKRQHPELDSLWSEISLEFLGRLDEWRKDLPVTEVPVDGSFSEGYVTISSPNGSSLVRVPALGFPNSTDPCTSAVNYAAYLCTGMRARTRYLPDVGRELPPDAEQTALIICRIAAGIPPTRFGESFAYSYGMLPFVVGAHRWSTNQGLRNWVEHWLAGYQGPREGIWNVQQTLRLLAAMDRESSRPGWQFVCARVIDEQPDPSADLEESNSNAPFKVVVHGIERDSPSTNVIVVE